MKTYFGDLLIGFLLISSLILNYFFPENSFFVFTFSFFFLILFLLFLKIGSKHVIRYFIFWIVFVILVSRINFLPLDFLFSLNFSFNFEKIPHFLNFLKFFLSLISILFSGAFFFYVIFKPKQIFNFENLPLMWGFGTGFLSFILIFLGVWFNFNFSNILVIIPLISLLSIFLKNKLKFKKNFRFDKKFFLLSFAILTPFFITTSLHVIFYPELYWDSLAYGINLAKIYYKENKIPLIAGGPSLGIEWSSNFPPAHQVLLTFLFLNSTVHSVFSKLFSFTNSIFLIILTYFWSKELFKEKFSPHLSLTLLVSIPLFILFSRYSIFYIYFLLQISISLYFLYKFYLEQKARYLYISSIFAGFSLLSSYLGLIYILFLIGLFLFLRIRNLKLFLVSILIIGLIYSPWFFRNLIYLTNPFWPFGGGKYIDPIIFNNTLTVQNSMSKIIGFNFQTIDDLKISFFRFFFTYPDFYNGIVINGFRPFLTLFVLPSILIVLKQNMKKMRFFALIFIIQFLSYILIFNWFERYFISITLPIVFLSVFFLTYVKKVNKLFYFLSLILLFSLYFNSIIFSLNWDECHTTNKQRVHQIFENLGNYDEILEICYDNSAKAWNWISINIPTNASIATNDIRHYYIKQKNVDIDSWELKDLYYAHSVEGCLKTLCSKNITHLFLNFYDSTMILPTCLKEVNFSNNFELLKDLNNVKIYRINCG